MGDIADEVDLLGYVPHKAAIACSRQSQLSLTCCPGKILQDASIIESYKIEEKGFIVCMVSKVCFDATQLMEIN